MVAAKVDPIRITLYLDRDASEAMKADYAKKYGGCPKNFRKMTARLVDHGRTAPKTLLISRSRIFQ